jgi:hypothetical protein
MVRYVCPRCGESNKVEVEAYRDDSGRAKVRLTCRVVVHEEPVVQVFDDPDVATGADLTPANGLVHDLDLYTKLEDIVLGLGRPSEYGIVEHLFAFAHPNDYVMLWRRFGHVDTHGSKHYTLSTYLASLLGNLSRHGAVTYIASHGTGRWDYNTDISAWANPTRKDGPVLSWKQYAADLEDRSSWPATGLLPVHELDRPVSPASTAAPEEDSRQFEVEPLVAFLTSEAVARGEGRRQPAIAMTSAWQQAIETGGSPDAVAAYTRVLAVANDSALDRAALFSLAEIGDWDALHLASLIWGYGRFANLTHRKAVEQFVATDGTVRAEICEEARIDTRAAWNRWWIGDGQTAIPGLRVAMGTKLLYFAGYDSPARPRPLIYDRRVHSRLTTLGYDLANPDGSTGLVRWTDDYRPYLGLCAAAAINCGLEPEDVEHALFRAAS